MSFKLVGKVRDGNVVFREVLFRVDKVLEVFGNEFFERVDNETGYGWSGRSLRTFRDRCMVGEFLDHVLRGEGKERCLEL